jgi:very-short-patch-repair endonuclease
MNNSLIEELDLHDGVLDVATAVKFISRGEVRWRVESGRWQRPYRGIILAQSGPPTEGQAMRIAQLWAGPCAVVGGLTAATLYGFEWTHDKRRPGERPVHLILPPGRARKSPADISVALHYSMFLGAEDVHPLHEPPRTRIERSLVDAASWAPNERLAMAVLAAGVQQGKARVDRLRAVADRNERMYRRRLILEALADIEGGAQALSEIDFTRKVVRAFRLPEPERQSARRDSRGRRRYLDVVWDRWKVAVEIDGAQHTEDPLQRWEDMKHDIELQADGYQVLRFPAWVVRTRPDFVAQKIREALNARR